MKKFINTEINRNWLPLTLGLVIVSVWELLVRVLQIEIYVLPAPSLIMSTLGSQIIPMLPHLWTSLWVAVVGMLLSLCAGILWSALMDLFPRIKSAVYPFIVVSQTIPIVFIYPLLMIWFGFGPSVRVLTVILVCFFPITVNLTDGLSRTDEDLIRLFRSMGAGRLRTLIMVRFPGSLPALFSGLKISATYSIMGAVIGEWLGAKQGMGVYMMRSYKSFATPRVFAAILVVVILSLGIVRLVSFGEYLWNRKYPSDEYW